MKLFSLFLGISFAVVTCLCFMVPGAKHFQQPDLARMIFFHVPCAILSFLFQINSAWHGIKYFRTYEDISSVRCNSALEMSTLLATLTLATGILFSKVQWGTWWQWDPRQTSYLMLLLILGAGMILQKSIPDEKKRASSVATYMIITTLPAIFLVFVFPRLPHIVQSSFHPSQTLMKGELDSMYSWLLRSVGLLMLWTCVKIYRYRVRVEILEKIVEQKNEDRNMEISGCYPTVTCVEHSIPVHAKD